MLYATNVLNLINFSFRLFCDQFAYPTSFFIALYYLREYASTSRRSFYFEYCIIFRHAQFSIQIISTKWDWISRVFSVCVCRHTHK